MEEREESRKVDRSRQTQPTVRVKGQERLTDKGKEKSHEAVCERRWGRRSCMVMSVTGEQQGRREWLTGEQG
jgi:hypothetical protein